MREPPFRLKVTLGSKLGKSSLLAAATEDGAVHILNTMKREDWDYGLTTVSSLSVCVDGPTQNRKEPC